MENIDDIINTIFENWKRRIDYRDSVEPGTVVVSRKKKKLTPSEEEEDMPIIGDVKYGYQSLDHSGWVKLDGRLKSALTPAQQSYASSLGIGTNIPDASDTVLMQTSDPLGAKIGSMSRTLLQSDLPDVALTGSTNMTGNHSHGSGGASQFLTVFTGTGPALADGNNYTATGTTASTTVSGDHNHSVSIPSLNGGVAQTSFDVTPTHLVLTAFMYLGI